MLQYTTNDLIQRNNIIQSQLLFMKYLNKDIINRLIYLFDTKSNNNIVKYTEKERKNKGLNNSNVEVISEIYGTNKNKSSLFLIIKKNKIDFIHFTIHLCLNELKPEDNGIIHFSKDIYFDVINKLVISKTKLKKHIYALISVKQPDGKPNSLEFSIGYGYNTLGIPNSHIYDPEIQQEMDVIITVLNRLFDENNKEYYIGIKNGIKNNIKNTDLLTNIHFKTNNVLNDINTHTKIVTRKNKGIRLGPNKSSEPSFKLNYTINQIRNMDKSVNTSTNKRVRGTTRKIRK